MRKVLITEEIDELLIQGLTSLGYACDYNPRISQQEISNIIRDYVGIIVATRILVDQHLIDQATSLKFIARAGSGMENIDVAYATSKNIISLNSPEGNANSVGEHTLGLLLAMFHNIAKSSLETSMEEWRVYENRVHELEGRTIAIIGYGNTGKSFARKLQPFNMNVLAYDKYLSNYGDDYVRQVTMEEVLSDAEIVSFHIPLTSETMWMVNKAYLQRFKHNIHLINTSRGKIIRHLDLLQCIYSNKIAGAALDVFENENFSEHSEEERTIFQGLIKSGKVLFTPHIAGKSFESKKKIAETLLKKISMIG